MRFRAGWIAVLAIGICSAGQPVEAGLLGLELPETPRITVDEVDVFYLAGSDQLLITGGNLFLDTGEGASGGLDLADFTLTLNVTVDEDAYAASGALGVGSPVQAGGDDPMLTAELIDFGYLFYAVGSTQFNGVFEFLFEITGGELAGLFGGVGAIAGVTVDAGGGLAIDNFEVNFGNVPGSGTAVAAPIPTPGVLALLGLAALGQRRRRSE